MFYLFFFFYISDDLGLVQSDVVLLPCPTKLQLGSAKARPKQKFDSNVVPESQIQDVLEPHNKSPHTFPRKHSPTKMH